MKTVRSLLGRRIGPGSIDGMLTRWGLCGGGLAVLVTVSRSLPGLARNRAELVSGIAAAAVLALFMGLLGVLGGRFHDAAARGELRTRRGAILSFPAAALVLAAGGRRIGAPGVGEAGLALTVLLALAAAVAVLCLGVAADLSRSARG